MLSARGVAPASPPLPPLLPLTFSLQPQVLQLEYLYADALSTCSSCFPSFTLVPLLPLPRTLPLSLSPPLSLSLPLSLFLSRFVHIIYAHCKNLSPPERLRHICFCGFSLTAQQPYPECSSAPPLSPLQPYPNRVDWSKRLLLRLSWILALDSVDLALSPFVLHCDTHTHTNTCLRMCVCVFCHKFNMTCIIFRRRGTNKLCPAVGVVVVAVVVASSSTISCVNCGRGCGCDCEGFCQIW